MSISLVEIIKKYFDVFESGSIRDIYFRLGRRVSYYEIQKVLDELEKTNYIQHKSVRGTRYKRTHYIYYRTFMNEFPLVILLLKYAFHFIEELFR